MQDSGLPIDADRLRRAKGDVGGNDWMPQGEQAINSLLRYRLLDFKGITARKEPWLIDRLLE